MTQEALRRENTSAFSMRCKDTAIDETKRATGRYSVSLEGAQESEFVTKGKHKRQLIAAGFIDAMQKCHALLRSNIKLRNNILPCHGLSYQDLVRFLIERRFEVRPQYRSSSFAQPLAGTYDNYIPTG